MSRLLGIALCLSLVILVGATLMGRAIDTEIQDRVLITRAGVTLDCQRSVAEPGEIVRYEDGSSFVAEGGEVSYGDCHVAP